MSSKLISDLIASDFTDPYKPKHENGPDYIRASDEIRSWIADGAVKIIDDPSVIIPSTSIVTEVNTTVKAHPERVALVVNRNGEKVKWTYKQYLNDIRTAAKGFIKLGLIPYHGVCMLGFNSPEWVISHLAAIFAGGFAAGIYTTNSPEACFHVLNDCDANIVVVENEKQLEKILQIRNDLPQLKAIIQYSGTPTHQDVISWNDLLLVGQSVNDDILESRIKDLAINQCAFLIYTSGTTGNPKGVMLSHDNIFTFIHLLVKYILPDVISHHRIISYLPLSHLAALATDVYAAIKTAATVYFSPPEALKGKMIDVFREVQPTVFLSVPRIVEKIHEKIQSSEKNMNWVTTKLISWAKRQSLHYHLEHKQKSNTKPIMYNMAKTLVLNKIKNALGMQHIETFTSIGAPLLDEIKTYFASIDFMVLDSYGLSESTAGVICTTPNDNNFKSVGNINLVKEYKLKIDNPDEDGNGEILIYGRNIFMGYLKLEKETKEAIDDDRWLHSGDLGKIDNDGYLYITGRIKELIITSGGENIPPVLIEEAVKKNLPVISNCILIGDQKKYLTMLITLKTEVDSETFVPIDKLSEEAISWCQSVGSEAKTVSEILESKDAKIMEAIQAGIHKYNEEQAISNAQKIQKWNILPQDFSIANGEIGPTGKFRRPIIVQKFAKEIDDMYST